MKNDKNYLKILAGVLTGWAVIGSSFIFVEAAGSFLSTAPDYSRGAVTSSVMRLEPSREDEVLERIAEPVSELESSETVVEAENTPVKEQIAEFKELVEETPVKEQIEELKEIIDPVSEDSAGYFDVPLDEALQDHIFAECEKYSLDPAMIIAMIDRESEFDIYAIGDQGRALGLMQIHPRWHEERMYNLQCWDLLDPYQNITVAVDYIAELLEIGDGTIEWVLMAYNGGEAYADRYSERGEVSEYALDVMAKMEELG